MEFQEILTLVILVFVAKSAKDLFSLFIRMYKYPSPKNKNEKVEKAQRKRQILKVSSFSETSLIFHACMPRVCPSFAIQK